MDRDKLILQFIENELTPEQLRLFQEELSKSSELQSEVKKYLHLKKTTDNLKNVRLNQKYLDSIIPDFRNSFENQNRVLTKRNLGYVFGVLVVAILTMLIFNIYLNSDYQSNDLEKFAHSLNEEQKIEILENLNGDHTESDIVSEYISDDNVSYLLASEIKIDDNIAEDYDFNYSELISGLNMNEVNKIYNELLNQDF